MRFLVEYALTGDIFVEDIVLFNGVIDQIPTGFVHHQHFPLLHWQALAGIPRISTVKLTSLPPVYRTVSKITGKVSPKLEKRSERSNPSQRDVTYYSVVYQLRRPPL